MSESVNVTPRGRAAFVYVWQPQKQVAGQQQPEDRWRYSITVLFDEESLAPLKAAARAVAIDKYGSAGAIPKTIATPWESCRSKNQKRIRQGKEPWKGFKDGLWAVNFNRNCQRGAVGVVDHKNRILQAADNLLYPGCEVRVRFSPFWTDKGGTERLCFELEHVQVVGAGERLDGFEPIPVDKAFDETTYYGEIPASVGAAAASEQSPTEGADDDPF